jgi:hypothetical protein
MADHVVQQGECVESIAMEYGFFWDTIWLHPNNSNLRNQRRDPNVLLPGDLLYIPEKSVESISAPTDKRHRFVRKGVPSMFRLTVMRYSRPFANQAYTLIIDGRQFQGKTDNDGRLEQAIPPNAQKAKLIVGEGDEREEYYLCLGHLDPIDTVTGIQARLNNLGFDCGTADGTLNDRTREALREFQKKNGIAESGEIDQNTRSAIEKAYGR